MAKKNWKALQIEYLKANAKTGITVKDWCEKKGLKFASAKRYIKKPETMFNQSKNHKMVGKENQIETIIHQENCELNCETDEKTAKRKQRSYVNSQTARKHGGYARYFKDKSAFDVVVDFSLKDEIDLMRQRAVSAVESIEKFTALLAKANTAEEKSLYAKLIESTDKALERAVGRIENLNHTDNNIANLLSQIELRKVQSKKVMAETEKLKQEMNAKTAGHHKLEYLQEFN